jgi:hypothetical protein
MGGCAQWWGMVKAFIGGGRGFGWLRVGLKKMDCRAKLRNGFWPFLCAKCWVLERGRWVFSIVFSFYGSGGLGEIKWRWVVCVRESFFFFFFFVFSVMSKKIVFLWTKIIIIIIIIIIMTINLLYMIVASKKCLHF